MELARRLDRETDPRCLVGFTRSPKGANDPLLQVVSDLYQRWLSDASAWEQLKAVWDQQKDGLLPAFARFVGKLSEKAAKLVPLLGELGGTAIRESLEGLVAATEDLRSGRLIVSRLEYAQAQELVSSVRNIAGRRIALVMDQWEETREARTAAKHVSRFFARARAVAGLPHFGWRPRRRRRGRAAPSGARVPGRRPCPHAWRNGPYGRGGAAPRRRVSARATTASRARKYPRTRRSLA